MATLIDGKKISAEILVDVKNRAEILSKKGRKPGLATVLVGDDPASHVYVGQKIKKCEANGIASIHRPLPSTVSQAAIENVVRELNADPAVHGMIVQLPLPKHIDSEAIINLIDPKKDADGLHPFNQGQIGRLKTWKDIISSGIPIPCTPAGVIELLLRSKIKVEGSNAVVIGRSTLVGKPVAQLLLSLDATVTMAHSRTKDLASVCKSADILIAALGKPGFVQSEFVKKGATIIDVGISRTENGVKGDVDFDAVNPIAGWITPVPGGVGPMTVAMLLLNTVRAAEK